MSAAAMHTAHAATAPGAPRPPSLIRRLIAWQALALVVAWLALASVMTWVALERSPEDIDTRLRETARIMAEAASGPEATLPARMQAAQGALLRITGRDLLGIAGLTHTRVLNTQGQVLYRSSDDVPWPDTATDTPSNPPWHFHTQAASDGSVVVQVAEPGTLHLGALLPVLWLVLKSQLGVFLWHGLVVWVTVRSGLAPLRQLAQRISRRRAGDLAPVQVDRLYAETAPVIHELNALLAHEAQRLEAERRFLADAAHELRTPLAAINAQAHQLLTEPDPAARADAAHGLQQGITRASHLLTQLLTLARADAAAQPAAPAAAHDTLDVADLLRNRVALLVPLARARRIELALNAPEHLSARLDREGLCSVIDNLVDNAIRYGVAGGSVEVTLGADGATPAGFIVLQVQDNGRGIAPEHRARVWERFYRIPGTSEAGTGLGLAIAQRVVQRMGGTLGFADGLDGRGVGLRCVLPREPLAGPGVLPGTASTEKFE
ncbi:HAMP domain-containing sensor histidine kinase [Acidovorax sp. NB1]|uniref:sensor histidine kinase n=1 Tax=Acidovorax sp. NB1 TaxID=1943571 RepID=UPI0010ECF83A|nr:ATP-binding protein [Acidovorax sp. NB1]GDY34539.1 sensor histidine kinase [Acidovorax sp. NB1]